MALPGCVHQTGMSLRGVYVVSHSNLMLVPSANDSNFLHQIPQPCAGSLQPGCRYLRRLGDKKKWSSSRRCSRQSGSSDGWQRAPASEDVPCASAGAAAIQPRLSSGCPAIKRNVQLVRKIQMLSTVCSSGWTEQSAPRLSPQLLDVGASDHGMARAKVRLKSENEDIPWPSNTVGSKEKSKDC